MRNCFDFCFHCGCLGHNIISCYVLHTHFEFSYDSFLRADPRDSHFSSRTVSALQSSSSSSFSVSHSPSQYSLQNKQSYKNFPCSPQNHSHPDSLLLLHGTNSRLVGLSSPVPSPTPSYPTDSWFPPTSLLDATSPPVLEFPLVPFYLPDQIPTTTIIKPLLPLKLCLTHINYICWLWSPAFTKRSC